MNVHELLGRAVEEREQEHQRHLETISVLDSVVSGRIARERIIVSGTTWTILAEPQSAEAAQAEA